MAAVPDARWRNIVRDTTEHGTIVCALALGIYCARRVREIKTRKTRARARPERSFFLCVRVCVLACACVCTPVASHPSVAHTRTQNTEALSLGVHATAVQYNAIHS